MDVSASLSRHWKAVLTDFHSAVAVMFGANFSMGSNIPSGKGHESRLVERSPLNVSKRCNPANGKDPPSGRATILAGLKKDECQHNTEQVNSFSGHHFSSHMAQMKGGT